MSFPFLLEEQGLQSEDLTLLSPLFRRTVQAHLPCTGLWFVGPQVSGDGLPSSLRAGVEVVRSGLQPVKDRRLEPALYLPLWAGEQLCGVVVLSGVAAPVLDLPVARLLEKSKAISREMALVKQAALDPVTGLAGGRLLVAALAELLGGAAEDAGCHCLLLLEIVPREKNSERAVAALKRTGAALQSLIGHLAPPCHFGNGVFGLLWEGVAEDAALKMADQLLQWHKREIGGQAHIGLVEFDRSAAGVNDLLDQGWQALATARKRGPFGLCPYSSVAGRADHPLAPPPARIIARLRRLWQDQSRFVLVEWRRDDEQSVFPLARLEEAGLVLAAVDLSDERGYLLLPGASEKQAEEWGRRSQAMMAELGVSFSMGMAAYPNHNFKKTEMVANCRKALLHTAFFGAATFTMFDGVSLNISGDIYYNEGDMARAAREYQHGLQLDPKNVNLLNSLGVTHAQMTRYKKAIPLFEQVLEVDRSNFMALCNLGFAHLACQNRLKAIAAFEEALLCQDDYFDLLLQLGKLYLAEGRYAEAVTVLQKAEKVGPAGIRDVSHGAVHRFLGEAHFGMESFQEAMTSLQRAVRYNSRDAVSLSLLGLAYGQQGQGDDIARSLCRQAVDIEPLEWRHWLRLARVELLVGDTAAARKALQESRRLAPRQPDNFVVQAEIAVATGDKDKARAGYEKALRLGAAEKGVRQALARLDEE